MIDITHDIIEIVRDNFRIDTIFTDAEIVDWVRDNVDMKVFREEIREDLMKIVGLDWIEEYIRVMGE